MAVYEILEEIMNENGMSVAEVSKICNLPDSTVRGIIRRKQETIALEVAFKISNGLGVSLEKLNGMPEKKFSEPKPFKSSFMSDISVEAIKLAQDYEGLDKWGKKQVRSVADIEMARMEEGGQALAAKVADQREQSETSEELSPDDIFTVPIYSMPMSAGTGLEAEQEYPEDFLLKKRPPRGTSYIARVSGDSMEPDYYDGDLVFVHATVDIRIGQIGVFLMDGQQWIKELGDGFLISHNPDYEPRVMDESVRCQGLVLGVCDESYFE